MDKGKQPKAVCQICHKKGATTTTVLGEPVCNDCYKKQAVKDEDLFKDK